jgi:hypothetical protein
MRNGFLGHASQAQDRILLGCDHAAALEAYLLTILEVVVSMYRKDGGVFNSSSVKSLN